MQQQVTTKNDGAMKLENEDSGGSSVVMKWTGQKKGRDVGSEHCNIR